MDQPRQQMNIVIAGHVDHGKSTLVGRLLADTDSLPKGKLEQVKATCERTSKPFEYAFLIDALKDEQAQGITIDTARIFFKTEKRDYLIFDAPGHIEFLKNMVTGASRAEAALLVIDAGEGVRENSKRHGYMLSMLGIQQIAVVVNKMDLVSYQEQVFRAISEEYRRFLRNIDVEARCFIPISGMAGDNIATASANMPWYQGVTALQILDEFAKEPPPVDKPFRMPVQDIYKFTNYGDSRRIVAGSIIAGTISPGEEVVFYPSGKKSSIATIEAFNKTVVQANAGYAAGFTLREQIYIQRGEIAAKTGQSRPQVTSRMRVNMFWLGIEPMVTKKVYSLKLGTTKVPAKLEEILRVIDASDLAVSEAGNSIERHAVAECILQLDRAIAFDLVSDLAETSRFVIIDNYDICGGGIIREALLDKGTWVRDKVLLREYKWERSLISRQQRAERYNQKATLVLITGEQQTDRKTLAKKLEEQLFLSGRIVYFMGIGNVLYGVDADIKQTQKGDEKEHREHIRRLAEIAHILIDSGVILIVTAASLTQEDLEIIKATVHGDNIEVVWIGEDITTDITCDLRLPKIENPDHDADKIKSMLQDKGIIFRPW